MRENQEKREILDLGFLIGILDKRNLISECVPQESFVTKIGQNEEFTSPFFLRKNSLDSLILVWKKEDLDYSLEELIQINQRLFFVTNSS